MLRNPVSGRNPVSLEAIAISLSRGLGKLGCFERCLETRFLGETRFL
ncbi:MAG: hypothetical protein ABWU13_21565 [Limnospira maxima]